VRPRKLIGGLAREARSVARAETATHEHLRDRLLTAAVATILVDAIATVALYLLERHAPQSDVQTIGSAAFWTTSQLLTVSSQFQNPISTSARVIDVGLELYAITVVTAIAGSFAAFFHRRGLERDPLPLPPPPPPPRRGSET
jgi:hypothetical protein